MIPLLVGKSASLLAFLGTHRKQNYIDTNKDQISLQIEANLHSGFDSPDTNKVRPKHLLKQL